MSKLLSTLKVIQHMKTKTAIEQYAEEFFSLPTSEQDEWAKNTFGVSSRTFRRWCNACGVKVKTNGRKVIITKE